MGQDEQLASTYKLRVLGVQADEPEIGPSVASGSASFEAMMDYALLKPPMGPVAHATTTIDQ